MDRHISPESPGLHEFDSQENINSGRSSPFDLEFDTARYAPSAINSHVKNHIKKTLGSLANPNSSSDAMQVNNIRNQAIKSMVTDAMVKKPVHVFKKPPRKSYYFGSYSSFSSLSSISSKGEEPIGDSGSQVGNNSLVGKSTSISSPVEKKPSTSTTGEPFPDYYESCETGDNNVDKVHEEAYNFAFGKVVEEVIKFREIDARLTTSPPFDSYLGADSSSPSQVSQSEDDSQSTASSAASASTTLHHGSNGIHRPRERKLSSSETNRLNVLEEIKIILSNPNLKPNLKSRFIAMTNMVLRMEDALFRRGNANDPENFLSAQVTYEVRVMAVEIITYLAVIDKQLQEQVEDANRVTYLLGEVSKDSAISVYTCYKRMAHLVMVNLRKPRSLEQRLLSVFLELYDAYVYTAFLHIRNRQILIEESINIERLEVSRLLIALWDIHNRVIENYETYVNSMVSMKSQFFAPVLERLQRSPEYWQGCWDKHHFAAQGYPVVGDYDLNTGQGY